MKAEKNTYRRWIVCGFVLFLLIYYFITAGEKILSVCVPLLIGIALAYVNNLMIGWFLRHDVLYNRKIIRSEKIHQGLSLAMAALAILLVLVFLLFYLAPQLTASFSKVINKIPRGLEAFFKLPFLTGILPAETLESLQHEDWSRWMNLLGSMLNKDDFVRGMTSTATTAINGIATGIFSLLFTVYFTLDRTTRRGNLLRTIKVFIPEERHERLFHYMGMMNRCFRSFIVCQSLQAFIIGALATLFMVIFRFPYALMIGALNGLCALIPIIGGYVGAAVGTLVILPDSPQMALIFLVMIILIQNGVGTFVFPRLVGDSLGLPAVWTLAAVVVGSGLRGITGILLAVPLAAFGYQSLMEEVKRRETLPSPAPDDPGRTEETRQ